MPGSPLQQEVHHTLAAITPIAFEQKICAASNLGDIYKRSKMAPTKGINCGASSACVEQPLPFQPLAGCNAVSSHRAILRARRTVRGSARHTRAKVLLNAGKRKSLRGQSDEMQAKRVKLETNWQSDEACHTDANDCSDTSVLHSDQAHNAHSSEGLMASISPHEGLMASISPLGIGALLQLPVEMDSSTDALQSLQPLNLVPTLSLCSGNQADDMMAASQCMTSVAFAPDHSRAAPSPTLSSNDAATPSRTSSSDQSSAISSNNDAAVDATPDDADFAAIFKDSSDLLDAFCNSLQQHPSHQQMFPAPTMADPMLQPFVFSATAAVTALPPPPHQPPPMPTVTARQSRLGRPGQRGFFETEPAKDAYEQEYKSEHLEVLKFEGDVYCYTLLPLEIPYKPCGVFLQQHFDRAFTQFSLTQRRGSIRPRRIEVWLNPALEQRFYAFQDLLKRKGDSLQELFVFHGSSPDRLRSIMFEGFLIGGHDVHKQHGSVYGQGIYTSLCVDDAIQYSKGGRAVMMCLALPGLHSEFEELTSDSWSPRNQWRVFRKPEQLLPMCIVTY